MCNFPDPTAKWLWHSSQPQCVVFERTFTLDYQQPEGVDFDAGWIYIACAHIYSVTIQDVDSDYIWFFNTGSSKPGICDRLYTFFPLRKVAIMKVYVQNIFQNKPNGFVLALIGSNGLYLHSDNKWTWSVCDKPTPIGTFLKPVPENSNASCHDVCSDNSDPVPKGGCLKAYGETDGVDIFCESKKGQRVFCDCNSFVWPKSLENVSPSGTDVIVYTNPERAGPHRTGLQTYTNPEQLADFMIGVNFAAGDNPGRIKESNENSPNIAGYGGKYAKVVPDGLYQGEQQQWIQYVQSIYIPSGKQVEFKYYNPILIKPVSVMTLDNSTNKLDIWNATRDLHVGWPSIKMNSLISLKVSTIR